MHPIALRQVHGKQALVIHCGSDTYKQTVAVNIQELRDFIENGGIVAVARTSEFNFFCPAQALLNLAEQNRKSGKEYGVVRREDIPVYYPGYAIGPSAKPAAPIAGVLGENPDNFYNPTLERLLRVCKAAGVGTLTINLHTNRIELA
jgi:hypothetical protein